MNMDGIWALSVAGGGGKSVVVLVLMWGGGGVGSGHIVGIVKLEDSLEVSLGFGAFTSPAVFKM